MKELKTGYNTVGAFTYMSLADPWGGNALRNEYPRSEINTCFEEALRHDSAVAHEQQADIKALVTSLKAVLVCLEQHIKDEAERYGVKALVLCPCTETEIKQAKALIAKLEIVEKPC